MRFRNYIGLPKLVGGIGIQNLDGFYIWSYATGVPVAAEPLLNRPKSLHGKVPLIIESDSEGAYIEDLDLLTSGFNFPVAEQLSSNAVTTKTKVAVLSRTVAVIAFIVATKLYVRPIAINTLTRVMTFTEAATLVNNAATTDIDICKLSSTEFACSYVDDGGSDYLCVRGGSLDSDGAITLGDEKELNAGALAKTAGTSIVLANTLTVCIAYALTADKKGLAIASNFDSDLTFSAGGTAVEFDGGDDTKEITICSHTVGDVAVVYQAGGDTNDPITMCCGTVSTAKAIVFGAEVSMAGAASAATGISCAAIGVDRVAFSWIDSTFLHVNMATIALSVPTKKTELALTTTAALTSDIQSLDNNNVIISYEDDANANDAGKVVKCSVSGTTWTNEETDQFTHASTQTPTVGVLSPDELLLHFQDVGNTNKGKVMFGHWKENLIDVRQETASKPIRLLIAKNPGRKYKA